MHLIGQRVRNTVHKGDVRVVPVTLRGREEEEENTSHLNVQARDREHDSVIQDPHHHPLLLVVLPASGQFVRKWLQEQPREPTAAR